MFTACLISHISMKLYTSWRVNKWPQCSNTCDICSSENPINIGSDICDLIISFACFWTSCTTNDLWYLLSFSSSCCFWLSDTSLSLEMIGCLSSFFEGYFNKLQLADPHPQFFELSQQRWSTTVVCAEVSLNSLSKNLRLRSLVWIKFLMSFSTWVRRSPWYNRYETLGFPSLPDSWIKASRFFEGPKRMVRWTALQSTPYQMQM